MPPRRAVSPAPTSIRVPVLLLTGSVGVGKTSVAGTLSGLLTAERIPHAVADMDWLRYCYPLSANDPYNTALGLRNLAAVWTNYHAAGAHCLITTTVVESRADVLAVQQVIPGAAVFVVRLRASLPTILRRLAARETGEGLQWHQQRAAALVTQMERTKLEDLLIDTEDKAIDVVAAEIRHSSGWPSVVV